MQIVIRPAAAADIEDAFGWYEQKRRGLGVEFLKIVDEAVVAIQRNLFHDFPSGYLD